MSAHIIALTAVDRFDRAEALAAELVDKRLAACVNIIGPVRSVFRWKGKVETSEERLLVIKTVRDNLERVRETLRVGSGYELPEFLVLDIAFGDESYLNWLTAQCSPAPHTDA